jgi:hypothetical protein
VTVLKPFVVMLTTTTTTTTTTAIIATAASHAISLLNSTAICYVRNCNLLYTKFQTGTFKATNLFLDFCIFLVTQ